MNIVVHTICWNEELMLPYFFRHYEKIASKIVVYDNYSSDSSQDIIKNHPKSELKFFDTRNESREDIEIKVKGNCWKENKLADWVIVVDCDEFIYHPNLIEYLEECKNNKITIPLVRGIQMVHDKFPETEDQIYDEIKYGVRSEKFDKFAIFNPQQIEEINYGPGCHPAIKNRYQPKGNVLFSPKREIKLLHFKLLGLDYLLKRYKQLANRKSQKDIKKGYGRAYFSHPVNIEKNLNHHLSTKKKIIPD